MTTEANTRKGLSPVIPVIISLALLITIVILPAQAADPSPSIEELQQLVRDQGYNYTVAENWVTQLSPQEREALFGYRPLEAPTEPVSGNISFSSHVPAAEAEGVGYRHPLMTPGRWDM